MSLENWCILKFVLHTVQNTCIMYQEKSSKIYMHLMPNPLHPLLYFRGRDTNTYLLNWALRNRMGLSTYLPGLTHGSIPPCRGYTNDHHIYLSSDPSRCPSVTRRSRVYRSMRDSGMNLKRGLDFVENPT